MSSFPSSEEMSPFSTPSSSATSSSWTGSPIFDEMLSSFVFWSLGDILAQTIETFSSRSSLSSSSSSSSSSFFSSYSALRTLRLAIFGSCLWAPCTFIWFDFLQREIPGSTSLVAFERMLADQLLYAPLVIASLFVVIGFLEGLSSRAVMHKLRAGFLETMLRNWMIWPLAQFVLQGMVPLQYRIVGVNLVNIPWTAYLAFRAAAASSSSSSSSSSSASSSNHLRHSKAGHVPLDESFVPTLHDVELESIREESCPPNEAELMQKMEVK